MSSRTILPLSSPPIRLLSRQTAPLHTPHSHTQRQIRYASSKKSSGKKRKHYLIPDVSRITRFSLCDAMRYIRAFEVGYPPSSPKYEAHIRLRTLRDGPVIRNRITLPHPVRSDLRVAVIVDPSSPAAEEAKAAGASQVGSVEEIIGPIVAAHSSTQPVSKEKQQKSDQGSNTQPATSSGVDSQKLKIDFDRLVVHPTLLPTLAKMPGIARILGPKGLMPSVKTGTVTPHVVQFVREATSSVEYRERTGVIRLAVGQLGFSADQVRENLETVVTHVKKDASELLERNGTAAGGGGGLGGGRKEVHEIVLSSTHGPGFSLNGDFRSAGGVAPEELRQEL